MPKCALLFPIETQVRELDFRLFLAAYLADAHTDIIIAHNGFFDRCYHQFPHSLYLGKRIFTQPAAAQRYHQHLQANAIDLLFLDEEGGVYMGTPADWEIILADRIYPCYFSPNDFILAWGRFQQHFYQQYATPLPPEHILKTGHPRFDLYRPAYRDYFKPEIENLKKRYGDYILINTNLTAANNLAGLADTFSPRFGYQAADAAKRLHAVAAWNHIHKTLGNLIELAHILSARFPQQQWIVRPHPGEDIAFYQAVFQGVPNIHVIREGAVATWLMGATAMIHDGCTTAIEAFLAGTPVINYKSVQEPAYDIRLPNQIGTVCTTPAAAIDTLLAIQADPAPYRHQHRLAAEDFALLENLYQDQFPVFVQQLQVILRQKRQSMPKMSVCRSGHSEKYWRYHEARHALSQWLKSLVRPLWPEKARQYQIYRAKFPGFTTSLIQPKMARIEQIIQRSIQFKIISSRLMMITSQHVPENVPEDV